MIIGEKVIGLNIRVMAGLDAWLDRTDVVSEVRRARRRNARQDGTFFHSKIPTTAKRCVF